MPSIFLLLTLVGVYQASALHKCPKSCKCHSRDVFCIGDGLVSMPTGVPWNKTLVYIRDYKTESETLKAGDIESNNVTKSLTLQGLGISDIEDGSFENFENVEFLNLNENNLTQLRDGIFVGLERIKILHICRNRIKEIDMTFNNVKTLLFIDFSYNRISNLTWLSQFGSNQINIPFGSRYSFSHKYSLVDFRLAWSSPRMGITLSNNPLSDVNFVAEESFRFGVRLILLDIGLQRIPHFSMAISYLDLSYNNITTIEPGDILNIGFESRYMNDLLLNNNNLITVAPGAFTRLRSLKSLHLENNKLESFPQHLPNSIYFLHLSNNRIKKIERYQFKEGWFLNHLALTNNKISQIFPCSFCGLARLQYLLLDWNCISTLPEEGFMGLYGVEMLSLSHNAIQKMESGCFVGLRKIKILDMSFIPNEIDIDGDIFDPLVSLEELLIKSSPHLSNFLLSSFRSLATLKNIRRLDISHNKIISLKMDISKFFPRLRSLDVSANRWQCSRNADFIINLLRSQIHALTHDVDIICH